MIALTALAALASPWPELSFPASADPSPADAAVVVGIDRYFVVDEVPGATRNAEDWYHYLTTTRGISPARVRLLRDGEATRERVLAAARAAADQAGPDGQVWFVFIGHGVPTPDGKDGVLVGVDAQPEPDALFPRGVRRSEVLDAIGARPGVLVLDTCFSGRSTGGSLLPGMQFLVPNWAFAPAEATVLAAGSATEFAGPLPDGGRPAFSYLVLGGLLGWADADADGAVTAAEAATYARDALAATVRGRSQTPEWSGPDRPLARALTREGPDLASIALGSRPAPPPRLQVPDALSEQLLDLQRAQAARLEADRRELALRERLEAETRAALEAERQALLVRARDAWAVLEPMLVAGGAEAEQGARAFVDAFRDAHVVVGDAREPVRVPEVDRASAWLGRSAEVPPRVTLPEPPPYTPVPWGLWVQTHRELTTALEAGPPHAWTLLQAAHHLPAQIESACGGSCPDRARDAELLVSDLATYTSTLLDGRFEALSARETGFVLLGIRIEARDLWRASTGSTRPLLLDHPDAGLTGDPVPLRAGLLELADGLDRREAPEKCAQKIDDAVEVLVARFDAERADPAALAAIHRRALALAKKADRCR